MATINVYMQYFEAACTFNGVERHAAAVYLISDSSGGQIKYEVAVSFFPHEAPDDYAISYDAYGSKVVFEAAGRRSKKREAELMAAFREVADEVADQMGGRIDWEHPLIEARMG